MPIVRQEFNVPPESPARAAARRIVEEVLADHAARGTTLDGWAPIPVPSRPDTPAWRAARRIVEDTLAGHAIRVAASPVPTLGVDTGELAVLHDVGEALAPPSSAPRQGHREEPSPEPGPVAGPEPEGLGEGEPGSESEEAGSPDAPADPQAHGPPRVEHPGETERVGEQATEPDPLATNGSGADGSEVARALTLAPAPIGDQPHPELDDRTPAPAGNGVALAPAVSCEPADEGLDDQALGEAAVEPGDEPFGGWAEPIAPEPRTGRWLLTTILGAIALAWLFPLAIGAVRDLVSLS